MAVTWEDLVKEHGTAKNIPHRQLYDYISRQDVKESITALRQVPGALEKRELYTEVRRRCQQDLMWLAGYFTWDANAFNYTGNIDDNLIREETHSEICDFFVHKDPSKSIADQDWRKDRLLLYPRGSAKSSIDIIDAVQWLLAFPHIRLCFISSVQDLANGFVEEVKGYFVIREENPTLMNLFWPEFCVESKKTGAASEFWCPVFLATGKRRKEPSVFALGAESSISGWHSEVIKVDDIVTTDNSTSDEQCRKISHAFNINRKMLLAFGYCDRVGTRYSDSDMYGEVIERNVGNIQKSTPKPGLEIIENLTTGQMILIGRAIQIKPDVVKKLEVEGKPVTYREAGEDGVDLLLPALLPYAKLMFEFNADDIASEGQYNQNPRPAGRTTFDRPLIDSCIVDYAQVPTAGVRVQTWDFAFAAKKKRDFCTCASAIFDQDGRMFVQDLVRDRFRPTDLAKKVVEMAKRWRPAVIGIENAGGSQLLEPAIIAEANKTADAHTIAVCSKIDWIPVDRSPDAKKTRMASLHPWMCEKRLLFTNHLPFLDVLITEFERCLTSSAHDDIPDVVSYLPRFAPKARQLMASQYKSPLTREDAIAQATYNLLYGEWLVDDPAQMMNAYGKSVPIPMEPEPPEPEIEIEAQSQIPGVISPLGSGLVG